MVSSASRALHFLSFTTIPVLYLSMRVVMFNGNDSGC